MFHLLFLPSRSVRVAPLFHESGFRISAAAVGAVLFLQQVLPTDRELLLIGSEAFGLVPRLEKKLTGV
jgi:hypothetical protein